MHIFNKLPQVIFCFSLCMCIHVVYMLICTLMKVCMHIKMHACENLRLSSRIFLIDSLLDKLFEAGLSIKPRANDSLLYNCLRQGLSIKPRASGYG